MGLISVSLPADGTTADVADFNTPITTIVNAVNGNLDNSNIASGAAIDPSKIAGGSASMLSAWVSWTPTFTNLSGGTLNYAKYMQIGKTVHCRFKYTLAGAGMGSAPTLTLPVTANADYTGNDTGETYQGTVSLIDAGTSYYVGFILQKTTTTAVIRTLNTSANMVGISSSSPFTWGNTDFVQAHFTYEAA